MNLPELLSEASLVARLTGTEHEFVERKPLGQKGEWLQTVVAFANSAPIGWPAILYVGVDDQGSPQCELNKLEELQQKLVDTLDNNTFPPVYRLVVPLKIGTKGCLAVIVPGSDSRPHFAGQAYARVGHQNKIASQDYFDRIVAQRQSKVYEILKWRGRGVKLRLPHLPGPYTSGIVVDCNVHYVTLNYENNEPYQSHPLARVILSFDRVANCLLLELHP